MGVSVGVWSPAGAEPCRKPHGVCGPRLQIPGGNRSRAGMRRGPYHDCAGDSHCNPRGRYPEDQAVSTGVTANPRAAVLRSGQSAENAPHDLPMDVREAEVAPLETIGQTFVIDAHEVKQGRLEIVDVDGVADRIHAEVIGGPEA